MAHPAFVWSAYYRQNRGSFPSAFPAGKLDALAICEEEDGEGRKALITSEGHHSARQGAGISGTGVGKGERGAPCPLQSHHSGNPVGSGRFGGCPPGVAENSCKAGIPLGLWAPCALSRVGFIPGERREPGAAPAAGSPLGGSVHPLTFAKRKNSINSSRQIKYK